MTHFPRAIIFAIIIALFISACAVDAPVVTPAPVLLSTAAPGAEATLPASAPPATVAAADENAASTVSAPPAPTPTPLPDEPTVAEALAAGLSYVESGFKLKLPDADSFTAAPAPDLNSVEIEQALASGPWLVSLSPVMQDESGRLYRTVIITNDSGPETMSWWGQVDADGVASNLVFSGMPRPKSGKINGMMGKIVQLPPGSAYPRYFENEKGRRFGISSSKESIIPILENMTAEDGLIQVWGELRYAVDDYNGRRILLRNYDLKDIEPETILARAQTANDEAGAASSESETAGLGSIAIVYAPKPQAVVHDQVQVSGEVDNPAGEQVIVRVEDAAGQRLGESAAAIEPPQDGRALFTVTVPFSNPPGFSSGRIAIYAPDVVSGQPMLLGWQEVRFAGDVGDRRVSIVQPEAGASIRGQIQVAGQAENIPSGSLLVRVEDNAGIVMGKARAKINPQGAWQSAVKFRRPKTARQGVIAIYDVSPDDGALILLAQLPVRLKR